MTGQKRGPLSTTRDSDLRRGFDRSGPNFSKGTPFSKHPSFAKALEQVPAMNGLAGYLTSSPDIKIFGRQAEIEGLRSSYRGHGYGYLFYGITRVFKPEVCVELGVLQGFSLLTVAAGLRDNGSGEVYGYDLFEEYPYHNDTMANVEQRIRDLSLGDWVHLEQADASQVSPLFDSVDFLHVDISNSGDTYRQVFQQWAHKVKMAMVLEGGREGGSPARDRVEWMLRYAKPPIVGALEEIRASYKEWDIFVLDPYPSVTIALRNRKPPGSGS